METKIEIWKKFYRKNYYYHSTLQKLVNFIIPQSSNVLEFSSKCGELLSSLPNRKKAGVEYDAEFVKHARKLNPSIQFYDGNSNIKFLKKTKIDYIIFNNTLSEVKDVQQVVNEASSICGSNTRIVVFYFNFLWKPILDLGEKIGLKRPEHVEPNWLSKADIDNIFYLEDFESVRSGEIFLIPYSIPLISNFINKYISPLPLVRHLCLINFSVYRQRPVKKAYSVSIIVPARNESGNIKGLLKKIPMLGKKTEVLFVEGHSTDNTYKAILEEIRMNKRHINVRIFKQKGNGKGDAVRLGFEKAKNELLMILDADLTVDPKELSKFYSAVSNGIGELIIGSRLVYPMERQAMRTLNYLGNKLFSLVFGYLLGQRIKDTLCGTKVLLRNEYERIVANRSYFGNFDPFGDFDLIFGASRLNLKIVEIPIRYKERIYGETNINRFRHGLLLLRMTLVAAKKIKFY